MDPNQFQAAVLAWGAAVTSLIGVLLAIALAVRSALAQVTAKQADTLATVAAVSTTVSQHDKALNGELTPRVEAIVDKRIALHRRPGDPPVPGVLPVAVTDAPPTAA